MICARVAVRSRAPVVRQTVVSRQFFKKFNFKKFSKIETKRSEAYVDNLGGQANPTLRITLVPPPGYDNARIYVPIIKLGLSYEEEPTFSDLYTP